MRYEFDFQMDEKTLGDFYMSHNFMGGSAMLWPLIGVVAIALAFLSGEATPMIYRGAYVVFDSRIHGWDGFVCGTARDGENKKNVLKEYECKECGKAEFSADIKILSQGPDDFAEELKDEICQGKFSKKDWINAFEWITVSLMCDNCGCRCEDFVDYETM